jgi:thiol-disulfide isomerase/thioredoxin
MKRLVSTVAGVCVVAAIVVTGGLVVAAARRGGVDTMFGSDWIGKRAPELPRVEWLNSEPLELAHLRGKVVMIDFWDYTCVNCIRTLPYMKEWNKRYADKGLVIIGVHTPEFEFAKSKENVARAVREFGIEYPVAVDSDYRIWNAYANMYWPRKLLIDKNGTIVYDHAGEGGYHGTEEKIQEVLREIDPKVKLPPLMDLVRSTDKPGAVCYPVTGEVYAGYRRGAFGDADTIKPDRIAEYADSGARVDGRIYLKGAWEINDERTRYGGNRSGDYLLLPYHAVEVNAVMKQENGSEPYRVWVQQDGKWLREANKGDDVRIGPDGRSYILIDSPRMYNIIRQKEYGSHELKLSSDSDAFGLYAFTFGSCER